MANLHLVTGSAGTPHVTAADHGSFNAAILGGGQYVLNRGSKLSASVITNNTIRIADGDILMQGRHIRLNEGSYVDLTIENGTQDMNRNDLIVARYTKDSGTGVEECNLVVIKGTAVSGTASDPAYTSGDIINDHVTQNDMPLYRVPLSGLNVQELVCLFDTVDVTLQGLNASKQDKTNALSAESSLADGDAFPFYDASASSNKKVLWSVIKSTLAKLFAPLIHSHTPDDIGAAHKSVLLWSGSWSSGSLTVAASDGSAGCTGLGNISDYKKLLFVHQEGMAYEIVRTGDNLFGGGSYYDISEKYAYTFAMAASLDGNTATITANKYLNLSHDSRKTGNVWDNIVAIYGITKTSDIITS